MITNIKGKNPEITSKPKVEINKLCCNEKAVFSHQNDACCRNSKNIIAGLQETV